MADIAAPRFAPEHPDYRIECEFALEPAFLAVTKLAEQRGWDPVTVARAMKSLATNYMLGREANAETDAAIKKLTRGRKT